MEELHPFTVRSRMRFITPPLREALLEFEGRLAKGQAGITVYGMPDTGKSTMMAYLYERITVSKKAVVYRTEMASSDTSERQLMRELASNNDTHQTFSSLTPKEAFVRGAQVNCERLGTPRVLLMIDEAQMLSVRHLELLRGVFASLTSSGLAPFAALFAQPEIAKRRWALQEVGDISLVNRFLGRLHRFRGLRRDELRGVMQLFDTTRWPENGPTYTEYFAPTFWNRGERLANWADSFALEFGELCRQWGRDPDDLPVSYLNEAIHTFYAEVADGLRTPAEMNQLVSLAVRASPASTGFEFMAGLDDSAAKPVGMQAPKKQRSRAA